MARLPDLIDTTRALNSLRNLTPADVSSLPSWIAAASAAVRKFVGMTLTRDLYDELFPSPEYGQIVLKNIPVNDIIRVAGNPTPVLNIINNDKSNQRASVRLTLTGDAATTTTYTGIELKRVASGVTTNDTLSTPITFASFPTIQAVVDQINSIGHGWYATPNQDFALWESADVKGSPGAMAANGVEVSLIAHVQDLSNYKWDKDSGIVSVDSAFGMASPWYWPNTASEIIWEGNAYSIGQQAFRIISDAGYSTPTNPNVNFQADELPEDIQEAVALVVQVSMAKAKTNPLFQSRTLGDFSYTLAQAATLTFIPDAARSTLSFYRDRHASEA